MLGTGNDELHRICMKNICYQHKKAYLLGCKCFLPRNYISDTAIIFGTILILKSSQYFIRACNLLLPAFVKHYRCMPSCTLVNRKVAGSPLPKSSAQSSKLPFLMPLIFQEQSPPIWWHPRHPDILNSLNQSSCAA